MAPQPLPFAQQMQLQQARTLHMGGHIAQARELYRQVLAADPDNAQVLTWLGTAEGQSGRVAEAAGLLARSLELAPNEADTYFQFGNCLVGLARIGDALSAYDRAVTLAPQHFDAWFCRGMALNDLGRPGEAILGFDRALALRRDVPAAFVGRGSARHAFGHFAEALADYDQALNLDPNHAEALYNRGNALQCLDRHEEAVESYTRGVAMSPSFAAGHIGLGNALWSLGRSDEAVASYDRALRLDAGNVEALTNRGSILHEQGLIQEALAAFDRALVGSPRFAPARGRRGNALYALDRFDEALADYDIAVTEYEAAPQSARGYGDILHNRGILLHRLGRFDDALADLDRVLAMKPLFAQAHADRGNALMALQQIENALSAFDLALILDPANANALVNRGSALQSLRRFDEAVRDFDAAEALRPDLPWLAGSRLIAHLQLAHWADFDAERDALVAKVMDGGRAAAPLLLHALTDDLEVHRQAAEIYAGNQGQVAVPASFSGGRREGPLRIGYVSSDFRGHPVAHLMAAIFEHHDRNQVEIFAFSTGAKPGDVWSERVAASVDHFIDVSSLKDAEIAERMRALEIDVAVDLSGFTQYGRPGILVRRAAPVQAAYLGFLGTMAMPAIDYLIADAVIIPQDKRAAYAEKIVYLPSFQPNDDRLVVSHAAPSRATEGLPDNDFVFCSFNQTYKLMPAVFSSWMRILKQVPGSVLWLYVESDLAADNLRAEAERRGVSGDRLVFARRVPLDDHLARLQLADLFLDSHPYNAGATASNALRVGLPVLTRIGQSFAARMGASLLTAAGVPELITQTVADYETLAVALASDPDRLAAIKAKLIAGRSTSALFDTAATARGLEALYATMAARHRNGLTPDHIQQT